MLIGHDVKGKQRHRKLLILRGFLPAPVPSAGWQTLLLLST